MSGDGMMTHETLSQEHECYDSNISSDTVCFTVFTTLF